MDIVELYVVTLWFLLAILWFAANLLVRVSGCKPWAVAMAAIGLAVAMWFTGSVTADWMATL
jgi:hypothetical protein